MPEQDLDLEQEPLLDELGDRIPDVYPLIHAIRADMMHYIDTSLSYADLTAPELTYSLVKPLEEKYAKLNNRSTVFCFLLNRVHFIRDQNFSTASLSRSRAALCEILATRTLRQSSDVLELAGILVTPWPIFEGAPPDVLQRCTEFDEFDDKTRVGNAIEMAIMSEAKIFIKSSPCQKVIDAIWSGKCVYTAESSHSLLSDTYKRAPIHYYDPRKAPLLDHYRLKVPAIRSVLEYINFGLLFILFVIALELNDRHTINSAEGLFMVYALGFTLEKLAAMQEHGVKVYIHGTWNGFDIAFIAIYIPYATLRLYGYKYHERWAKEAGIDCLALAACLMFPRLAFVTFSNNLLVLALRAMFTEFAVLMSVAAFCFGGFLYSLWTLSRGTYDYSPGDITWWMLYLWFGLDATGFQKATTFHPFFGPMLMVTYACLSNTLLLTVLVSILSHTFNMISSDAEAEARFRRAVATIEGVKADALFSYQPPLNLIAFVIMFPASYTLSPRWFHKVNVAMIRITAFPILLTIAFYERQTIDVPGATFYDRVTGVAERVFDTLPRRLKRLTLFEGLTGAGPDIDHLFEIEDELNRESYILHGDELVNPQNLNDKRPESIPAPSQLQSQPPQAQQSAFMDSPKGSPPRRQPLGSSSNDGFPSTQLEPSRSLTPRLDTSSSILRNRRNSHLGLLADGLGRIENAIVSSPLAQLFHPIVVDDDPVNMIGNGGASSPSVNISSSAGLVPIPRRRLTSMTGARHRRLSSVDGPPQHLPLSGQLHHPHARPLAYQHLAHSPPHAAPPVLAPRTVLEQEEGQPSVDWKAWVRRLEDMEQGQQRIENLLVALAGELRSAGNRPNLGRSGHLGP